MTDDWSRRALIGTLGTVSLAGCLGRSDGSQTGTDTQDGTGTQSNENTPTTTAGQQSNQSEDGTEGFQADPETPETVEADWPMPAADAGMTNYAAGSSGPTEPVAELWSLSLDAHLSDPVLADETVYVCGSDGVVRAVDATTGERNWSESVGDEAGTPCVLDDQLLVPTADEIVALGRTNGTETWRTETPGRQAMLGATHGVYWIQSSPPAVVSLARDDGSEQWRTELHDPWEAHLFASEDSVFVSSDVHYHDPWTLSPETGSVRGSEPERGYDMPAERFYLDGRVYAVEPFFGQVMAKAVDDDIDGWSTGADAAQGKNMLSGGNEHIYWIPEAGDEQGLYAFSRTDGTEKWHADVTAAISRPVVAEESVLVPTDESIRCFDPADGTELWSVSIRDIGPEFIVADDLVYATQGQTLRAFRPP